MPLCERFGLKGGGVELYIVYCSVLRKCGEWFWSSKDETAYHTIEMQKNLFY